MFKDFFNQNLDNIDNCEESCSKNDSPFDIDIPGKGICDPPQKVIINYIQEGGAPIGDFVFSVNGVSGYIVLDKTWVGLDLVDNTSDLNKPISILTQNALNSKLSQGDPISLLYNDAGYITISDIPSQVNADWNSLSGPSNILNKPDLSVYIELGDNITLLTNDAGYITLNDVPVVDLSNYYTKLETNNLLDNKISIGGDVSDLINDAGYITSADIPGAQTLSYSSSTGNLSISGGNMVNLDGRYSLIGHAHPISDITGLQTALNNKVNTSLAITNSYGITIGGSLSTSLSLGVDTDTLDARYLRKDVNDDNGTQTLTIGNLIAETATIESNFNLPSLSTGTSNDILVVGVNGLVQKKALVIGGAFGIANGAGTKQFDVDLGTNLRFQGTGDTVVSFNPTTMLVTINSVPGQGGGGLVTSFNGRTGGIVPESGDYTTSIVSEGTNLYHTVARVRATTLTGLPALTNTAILATDSILQAFGKAQGQINARASSGTSITVNGTAGRVLVSGGTQNLTANRTWTVDIANGIATAGTYPKVTVDTYGRVTSGANLSASDIPNLPTSKITSGVFDNARLGSGTAGTGTFLGSAGWTVPPNDNTTYSGSTSITLSGTSFQRAALSGDVTASANSNATTISTAAVTSDKIAANSVTEGKISNNAVSWTKVQNINTQRLLGRGATGVGNIQEISLGANLALTTAGVLSATNTTYAILTAAQVTAGTATTAQTVSAKVLADEITRRGNTLYTSRSNSTGGSSNSVLATDTRAVNETPEQRRRGVWFDFKTSSVIGFTGGSTYAALSTFSPYSDGSGNSGSAYRLAQSGNKLAFQSYASETTWGPWRTIYHSGNFATGTTSQYIRGDGSLATYANTTYAAMTAAEALTGTATTARSITAKVLADEITRRVGQDTNIFRNYGNNLAGNLNDPTWSGYRTVPTAANATLALNYPVASNGGSLLNLHGGTYVTQIFNDRSAARLFWRGRTSATAWVSWKEIYHTGNLRSNTQNDSRYFYQPTGTTSQYIRGDGSLATYANTTYSAGTLAQLNAGTVTTNYLWSPKNIADYTKGSFVSKAGDTMTGNLAFKITSNNSPVNSADVINIYRASNPSATGGSLISGRSYNNTESFLLRNYAASGIQLTLNQGGILSVGDVIAYSTSDSALKDSIELIQNPLDKLSKISGNSFVWNDKQDTYEVGSKDYGVIAQEVEKILPHAVTTRKNGYLAVKYEKIIPLLIEGIKALQEKVRLLEGGIN